MTTIIKVMPRTLMPPMTIAIAAEAATEPTEQRDDQDDDEDESKRRHGAVLPQMR